MDNKSLQPVPRAVQVIKTAILQSQERTTRNANADLIALNYAVGGYVSENTRNKVWGSGAIKQISEQLQKELPGLKGFSERNMRGMRQFYETWHTFLFWQPTAAESEGSIWQPTAAKLQGADIETNINSQPKAGDLGQTSLSNMLQARLLFAPKVFDVETAHDFISISFTHHMEILNKTDTLEERLFYIHNASAYKWDKYKLRDVLKQDLFHHQSLMPNNFLLTMPKRVQALKAIEMFKDEYLLDYINVEELGVRDEAEIDEQVVEKAIIQNVKNFIMTFGKDFAFVGNQYHLEKFNKDHFVDLLFYNRELTALVAVELKKGEFKPIYLAQLQTYLQLLDDEVKKPNENPSIGIILCQDVDKTYVEYVIQRYDSPMGVATYKTTADMPERLRNALPDIEELKKLISD